MGKISRPPSDDRDWDNHEHRISNLETSQRAGFTTVEGDLILGPGAKLEARDADGSPLITVGQVTYGPPHNTTVGVWRMRRADTTLAMAVDGADAAAQYVAMYDREQNIIFSDDTLSGVGLGRPWLPIPWWTDPNPTVTISTFWPVARAYGFKQHPKLQIRTQVSTSAADTTAEYQVRLSAVTVVIGPTAVPGSTTAEGLVEIDLPDAFGDGFTVALEIRRTAGTGTVTGDFLSLWEKQT
jgi:hypothetical protein